MNLKTLKFSHEKKGEKKLTAIILFPSFWLGVMPRFFTAKKSSINNEGKVWNFPIIKTGCWEMFSSSIFFIFLNELIKGKKFHRRLAKLFFSFPIETKKRKKFCGKCGGGNETEFNYFNFFPEVSVVLRLSWGLIEFWHEFGLLVEFGDQNLFEEEIYFCLRASVEIFHALVNFDGVLITLKELWIIRKFKMTCEKSIQILENTF